MWYSFDEYAAVNLTPVDVDRVKEIIILNSTGKTVETLTENNGQNLNDILGFEDLDKNLKNMRKNEQNRKRKKRKPRGRGQQASNNKPKIQS